MNDVGSSLRADGWVETEATIISCKRTLLSALRGSGVTYEDFYQPPEYTVVFQYEVVLKAFNGKYRTHSEQVVGSTLTIAYDPMTPQRNTVADLIQNPWIRVAAWSVGVGLAVLAIWLGLPSDPPF